MTSAELRFRIPELPEAAILKPQEVAAWLGVEPRQLERMGVPRLVFGHKTKKYLKRDVMAWLEQKRGVAILTT